MSVRRLHNIWHLGIKELRSLARDPVLLILIAWAFSIAIYAAATGVSMELRNAPIAVVDEDQSELSQRIVNAFYGPYFRKPDLIAIDEIDRGMDGGRYTFVLDIPPGFGGHVLAGRQPAMQLNVDATQMSHAFIGTGYISSIVNGEIEEYLRRYRSPAPTAVNLVPRMQFNPNLTSTWFASVMEIINNITMLGMVLAGAALIREREHGTIEHLLVMPLTPIEIMAAKIWANGLVVLAAATLSLQFVVRGALGVPIAGSMPLFLLGAAIYLFSATSLGILLATVARSMPQFGLLLIMVLLPLYLLSGTSTPRESMPVIVQNIMLFAPTTHFVSVAQAILYRGAGLEIVWPQLLATAAIGAVFFAGALVRFRKAITTQQG
ncbi:MAG TPA: ABC transporter permease [Burkholderiales bacterium]